MAIKELTAPQFFSDLTGCYYDSYAEACKAETRELLAQALSAETPCGMHLSIGDCNDLATWLIDRYPELTEQKLSEGPDAAFDDVAKKLYESTAYISHNQVVSVLTNLFRLYKVSVKEVK